MRDYSDRSTAEQTTMARLHRDPAKFKKIDAYLCDVRSAAVKAIHEIDAAIAAKNRTQSEREALQCLRTDCQTILEGFARASATLMDALG